MPAAHLPTDLPDRTAAGTVDDDFDRALAALARAGIAFEMLPESGGLERAA